MSTAGGMLVRACQSAPCWMQHSVAGTLKSSIMRIDRVRFIPHWHQGSSFCWRCRRPRPCAGRRRPTPEEYVGTRRRRARRSSLREFKLDGIKLLCGQRPTVIDNKLDDYGAAYPGFLITQSTAAVQGLDAGQAVDLCPRVRPPVPRAGRGDRRLLRRPARAPAGLADARRASRRSASSSRRPRATACTSRARTAASTCASASKTEHPLVRRLPVLSDLSPAPGPQPIVLGSALRPR